MKELSKKVLEYLTENEDTLLPDYQKKYKTYLTNNGFDKDIGFVQFMSLYSGEMYGNKGYLSDVIEDLIDYSDKSFNYSIHTNDKVPTNYISLTDDISEVYLLYDKQNGHVILIEGANFQKLLAKNFDNEWGSFNEFLEDFFELN